MLIQTYYEKNFNQLVKKMSRPSGSPDNAQDVVQEAFSRSLKYFHTFKGNTEEEFHKWFLTILSRSLRDFLKAERLNGGTDEEPVEEVGGDQEVHLIGKVGIKNLKNVIQLKKSPMKDVLTLYFLKGMKPREISQILDIPNKTVRMCVLRFKEKIDDLLKDSRI